MTDRTTISVNYEKMISLAQRITDIAGRLNNINRVEFEEVIEALRASWEGENAELFFTKSMNWQERTDNVKERLLAAANMIREGAEQYKAAEMAAIALLEQSSGGTATPT